MKELETLHSLEAEKGLLGCCIADPAAAMSLVIDRLGTDTPEKSFYDHRHKLIFNSLCKMYTDGNAIDVRTLNIELKKADPNSSFIDYLIELEEAAVTPGLAEYYLREVWEQMQRRQTIRVCNGIIAELKTPGDHGGISQIVDRAEVALLDANLKNRGGENPSLDEHLREFAEEMDNYKYGEGRITGISTGFKYLDKMTGGLHPTEMVVLAGRPGMGKTSIGMNIVENVAMNGGSVGVFSLEMSSLELVKRLIFSRCRGDYQKYRTGFLEKSNLPAISQAVAELSGKGIHIDDGNGSITDIRAKARRMKAMHDIDLIVIDYVQLVAGEGKYGSRENEVAKVSMGIKQLAKELNVPVLALAQMNRESERSPGSAPKMADLRETGQLEQDADAIMMLHDTNIRDDKEAEEMEAAGIGANAKDGWDQAVLRRDLYITKQRNGPVGDCHFLFHKSSMTFSDFTPEILELMLMENEGKVRHLTK
jgi:replicative DNA helicase